MRNLLLLIAACVLVQAQTPPQLRLPEGIKPLSYELDLKLVPEEDNFSGTVAIEVQIDKPAEVIWLNATGLKLEAASIQSGGKSQEARVIEGGEAFAGLVPAGPLSTGKARITVRYSGPLNKTDVEGVFKQQEGSDTYILTQFEPTSARRAFPSFDEPAFKTPFTYTLRVPKQHKAFSNTPQTGESEDGPLKVVKFARSKPLPTYLVAFAVGPFDVVDGGPVGRNKVPHRVIVPRGRAADVKYVVEVTPRIVAGLEEYFGIPYPYEKLDQITIPITVGFGAMENAGLITYQQGILLAKPGQDTPQWKRGSTGTITHEIAHQWFGNMVTPAWWDDIWLNEAFATWMGNLVTGKLFPEWKQRVAAVSSKYRVMEQDTLLTARKIRNPIQDVGDIGRAFDGITYQKGGAVIRMFENYVGADQFRKGVQAYMKKHAWGAATAADFVSSISRASGKNVNAAFSTFLDRAGVPLLTVDLNCNQGTKPQLEVTQQRSLPLGSKGDRSVYWQVPVCVSYENGQAVARQCSMLADPKDKITLGSAGSCPQWVYVGEGATGYYRVKYSDKLQTSLKSAAPRLSLQEQVDLLRNTWALVTSGEVAADVALGMVPEAAKSPNREIVATALEIVNGLNRSVPAELRPRFEAFVRDNFSERARSLGWEAKPGETEDTPLLRAALLGVAGFVGRDPEIIEQAKKLGTSWLETRTGVSPDLIGLALGISAKFGDRALFDRYIAAVKSTKDRRERQYIHGGLAQFEDPAIVSEALKLLLDTAVDVREYGYLLFAYQEEPATERMAWDFTKANYDAVLRRLPTQLGTGAGTTLIRSGEFFCNDQGRAEVAEFFKGKVDKISGGSRQLESTLEKIELCTPRRAAYAEAIKRFFQSH
ncbi:MAG TPA: M1 family metallopeptidase [Bryobacteraceae bacterium]|nr:M1 family metallopeptidase [Bryobacteraceae bacterium]